MTQIVRGEGVFSVQGCWEAIQALDISQIYILQISQNLDDTFDYVVVFESP